MHMGGALAKVVVRGELPSALGHGVSPVIEAPGPGPTNVAGWPPTAEVVVSPRLVVGAVVVDVAFDATVSELSPLNAASSARPPTTTTTTVAMIVIRRRRAERAASRRAS